MKKLLTSLLIFFLHSVDKLAAQTNIDFESGSAGTYTASNSVTGWTLSSQVAPTCTGTSGWTPGSQEFSLVATPILNFPLVGNIANSPLGGTVVAHLNDLTANANATRLSSNISVSYSNCALQVAYAGILQNGGHTCCEQASLKMIIKDASGTIYPCSSFSTAPGTGCSGVVTFSTSGNNSYSNWQVKYIDLSFFINSTITIDIIVTDCAFSDHYGSTFIDAKLSGFNLLGNNLQSINPIMSVCDYCPGANVASICTPLGYYVNWIAPTGSPTLSASQATSACITITNPIANAIYTANLTYPASAGSCTFSQTYVLVNSSVSINAIGQSSTCAGGASGSATVIASGSGSGYSYNWFNSSNASVSTYSVATSLAPGIYSVTVSALGSQSNTCGTSVNTVTVSSSPPAVQYLLRAYCNSEAYLFLPSSQTASGHQWYTNALSAISSSLGGNSATLTVISPTTGANYYLTYINFFGCRDSIEFTLASTTPGSLTILSNPLVCPGAANGSVSVQMTPALYAYPGQNYFSMVSTGTTSAYSSSLAAGSSTVFSAANLSAGGSYSINSFDGSCKYSQTFTVPVNIFDYTLSPGSQTVCSGNSIQAYVAFTSPLLGSQYSYNWSPGTFLFGSNAQNSIYAPTIPSGSIITTIYTVVVTSSVANCPVTKTLALTGVNLATPTISIVPLLCSNGLPYTPSASPGGGTFSGGGNIINGQIIPTTSFIGSNTFSYSISSGPCVAQSSLTYSVNPPPVISISGNTLICEGESVSFLASGASSYSWSTLNTSPVISVTPVTTSNYSVEGYNAATTCFSTKSITVTVVAHPTLSLSGDTLLCYGESGMLVVNGANSYLWSNGSGSQSISISPTINTTYTVIGTNSLASCSSTESILVKVSSCNFVGLKEWNLNELISVYPNPTTGKINIECKQTVFIDLLDDLGRVMLTEKIAAANTHTIDLSNYTPGIYFLKIRTSNASSTIKLIKTD